MWITPHPKELPLFYLIKLLGKKINSLGVYYLIIQSRLIWLNKFKISKFLLLRKVWISTLKKTKMLM